MFDNIMTTHYNTFITWIKKWMCFNLVSNTTKNVHGEQTIRITSTGVIKSDTKLPCVLVLMTITMKLKYNIIFLSPSPPSMMKLKNTIFNSLFLRKYKSKPKSVLYALK